MDELEGSTTGGETRGVRVNAVEPRIEWARKGTIDRLSAASTPHRLRRAGGHRRSSDLMDAGDSAANVAAASEMPGRMVVARTVWWLIANPRSRRASVERLPRKGAAADVVHGRVDGDLADGEGRRRVARHQPPHAGQGPIRCGRSKPSSDVSGRARRDQRRESRGVAPSSSPLPVTATMITISAIASSIAGCNSTIANQPRTSTCRSPSDRPRAPRVRPNPDRGCSVRVGSDHGIECGPTTDALRQCRPSMVEEDLCRYKGNLARGTPDNDRRLGMPGHGVDIRSTGSTGHLPCDVGSVRGSERALMSSSAGVGPRPRVRRDPGSLLGASRTGGSRRRGATRP